MNGMNEFEGVMSYDKINDNTNGLNMICLDSYFNPKFPNDFKRIKRYRSINGGTF
ncbi:hypothetical protein EXIGUO8A_110022 [Exiguobacterium sp. 8A]|nr:hypothetical protein EXIGUO8A_110022 [Exiguobacterium sp. 8A]